MRTKYTQEQKINVFWSNVNKNGSIPMHMPHLGRCWEWIKPDKTSGYGSFCKVRTHRFSWELAHGQIPSGLFVLHKCDNPSCVRPDHLFIGTQGDNMSDRNMKQRSRGAQPGHKDATLRNMQKIFEFVGQYNQKYHIPPTLKEIAVGIGKREQDVGNIQPLVKQLVKDGFLVNQGRFRSLMVAPRPPRRFYYKPE